MTIKKVRQNHRSKKSMSSRPELKLIIGGKIESGVNRNTKKKQGGPQFRSIEIEHPKENLLDPKERKIKNVHS